MSRSVSTAAWRSAYRLRAKMKAEGKPNHLHTTTIKRVLLLLCVLGSQIYICECQSSSAVSASGINCTPECGLGYRCELENGEPTCVKKCNRSCENKTRAEVCGTDGVTYRNRCELRKARCQLGKEINVTYPGPCITLPPPPEHLCKSHQKKVDRMMKKSPDEYHSKCNYDDLNRKANDDTLTLEDLLPCYRPHCTNDAYVTRQCSSNVGDWCWCSTPDGLALEGTLQHNLPVGDCDRQSCEYQGQTHKDGELFSPNGCGICECLNGTVSCFEDYVPDNSGRLNGSQLSLLKEEVMQVFHFQYLFKEHVLINIRHVHQHPTTIPDRQRNEILLWKFQHYDRNNDAVLFPAEEFIFQMELYEFVKCKSFFDHVSELVDDDSNGQISLQEWVNFFNDDDSSAAAPTSGLGSSSSSSSGSMSVSATQPSKRSVPPVLRKPLNLRKKFLYVLF